ncbi:MAG: hypothetical protein LC808_42030, partial [Actinobacteria bacterium]|nr:hypothetical protein [Actinomycetota bacterium]
AISFRQNNVWRGNTYVGDWHFTPYESKTLTWDQWRAAPYNQDATSTYNGATTVSTTSATVVSMPATTISLRPDPAVPQDLRVTSLSSTSISVGWN